MQLTPTNPTNSPIISVVTRRAAKLPSWPPVSPLVSSSPTPFPPASTGIFIFVLRRLRADWLSVFIVLWCCFCGGVVTGGKGGVGVFTCWSAVAAIFGRRRVGTRAVCYLERIREWYTVLTSILILEASFTLAGVNFLVSKMDDVWMGRSFSKKFNLWDHN